MSFFNVLSLIGGLALFLYGMISMGGALTKQAGGRFKQVLESITSNPIRGILMGTIITGVIQSSSATTVMVVGFVNSGIMTLENSMGIILGAHLGTSVTGWILSLAGIESSNFFLQMLKPSSFTPALALLGIGLLMFAKGERKKDMGGILLGFSVLMFGMETMSAAVKPLANVPQFTNILILFENPVLGVLLGVLVTGIIQSSSASVGILQAMSLTGSITAATAIPIILGQNIGTCVTALLSSIGTNANARRAAVLHLMTSVIGVVVQLALLYTLHLFLDFAFMSRTVGPLQIAVVHSMFNILNIFLILPFRGKVISLSKIIVRDDHSEEKFQLLDDRFLSTPSFALAQCRTLAVNMAILSRETLFKAMELTKNYNEKECRRVMEAEDEVDQYEDKLGTFMVKLSSRSMSIADSHELSKLLHCIGDFERISDHAVNIVETAQEMYQKNIKFSDEATADLDVMYAAVREVIEMGVNAFIENDKRLAIRVEPLEEVIDILKVQLKARHIARLQRGECTTMLGFVFSDLLTNFERVADHCSNIAVAVIQVGQDNFDTHEYLHTVKNIENEEFSDDFNKYLKKYKLIS